MTRVGAFVGLLLAAAAPAGAGAQLTASSPDEYVQLLRDAYDEAKKRYELATLEVERLRKAWNQSLEEHTAAKRAGDEDRARELLAELQERSPEKNRAENAWRTKQEDWIAAGKALVGAVDARLDLLWHLMERSVGATEYDGRYGDLVELLEEVEAELPEEPLELEPMPEVTIRREDTPREIEFKARVIENRVAFYEELRKQLDRDIESLTNRQRREHNRRDSRRARNRFGDDAAPTGDQRYNPVDAVATREPIEVRIDEKKALRGEVVNRMEELKRKARLFRQEAGGAR